MPEPIRNCWTSKGLPGLPPTRAYGRSLPPTGPTQSYSLRRQTMEPRIRPEIKTTTFAPSVHMTSRRSLAPSPTTQSQGSGYPATHHPISPG